MVRVRDVEHAASLAAHLDSILYLGDILISFGDFLENNHKLVPSAYVEEWWVQDFAQKFHKRYSTLESGASDLGMSQAKIEKILEDPLRAFPSFSEAQKICQVMQVPLHPKYLFYWDQITPAELLLLWESLKVNENEGIISLRGRTALKSTLERLGVEHSRLSEAEVIVTGEDATILAECLDLRRKKAKEIPRRGVDERLRTSNQNFRIRDQKQIVHLCGSEGGAPGKRDAAEDAPAGSGSLSRWKIYWHVPRYFSSSRENRTSH